MQLKRSHAALAHLAAGLTLAVTAVAGCSSSKASDSGPSNMSSDDTPHDAGAEAEAACVPYVGIGGAALQTPAVSFVQNVLPVFEHSCGLGSSCHGDPYGSRVYLGCDVNTESDCTDSSPAAKVQMNIVGKAPVELPTMPYVTAGDPTQSYLMHKMDGDACEFESMCVANNALVDGQWPPCGLSMPQGDPLIDVADRDTVRKWIAQGALQN